MNLKLLLSVGLLLVAMFIAGQTSATKLDEKCVINVLNRTIQVGKDGGWALPNVPSTMGKIRARATCVLDDGSTVSGQSDYFTIVNNGITSVGDIKFDSIEAVPVEMNFTPGTPISLTGVGKTQSLKVMAKYRDDTQKDVTAATNGINYASTNPEIATVSAEGVVTARGNGNVLINARKDGVLASQRVAVTTSGDLDGDGLPDDWELANGLNPSDPVDAQEDKDGDGLTTLAEYQAGTNPSLTDTDGDGLSDFKELKEINTNPLLSDTDGDGLNDNVELLTSTNPLLASSANYTAAVQSISVTPPTLTLVFNGVDSEASAQLKVTGKLIDGSSADLTSKSRGTTYSSNDLTVVNFGATDGKVYGGVPGNAVVTITNGLHSIPLGISVQNFTPDFLSEVSIPGYANNVDVLGDIAFVAAGGAGLQVIDISNRKSPLIIGSLDTDGIAIDVRVRGQYVYMADGESGLKIVDVSVPAAPNLVGSLDTAGIAQDVQVSGDYAYIADGKAGIAIINISNPVEPILEGVLENLGEVKGIDVENDLAVIVTGASLRTIDVSDKLNPAVAGSIYLGFVKDLVISKGYAYVAALSSGYRVVDIRDSQYPKVVGGDASFTPRDVELSNGLALFADQSLGVGTAYVNILDPESPVWGGSIYLTNVISQARGGATGLALDASYGYISAPETSPQADFGAETPSKFRINQYRMLSDNLGNAPNISLINPMHGQIVVENKNIFISAEAVDDVVVKKVEFLVDDVVIAADTTAPFETPFVVPTEKRFVNIKVRATDLGGNTKTSEINRINIQQDKDKDGLGNDEEVSTYKTNPNIADTDLDGILDGREMALGINPLLSDTDGDGLSDSIELDNKTDPSNPDIIKPVVDHTIPISNAIAVSENQGVIVTFSEPILAKSITRSSLTVKQEGFVETEGRVSLLSSTQLLFKSNGLLKANADYIVHLEGIRDLAGNRMAPRADFKFTTGKTTETIKPFVSSLTPAAASVNIPVNSLLNFIMSESIDPSTIDETKFYVKDTILNQNIAGFISANEDGTSINFSPSRAFLVGRKYQIYIGGIKDLFGNTMDPATFNFTTSFNRDEAGPEIVATSISNGDIEIALNARLRVLFSEPINSLSAQLLSLKRNGANIEVSRSIDPTGRLLSIQPVAPLEENAIYNLVLLPVEDLSGNLSSSEVNIKFTTGTFLDDKRGSVQSSSLDGSENVSLATKFKMTFTEPIDPTTVSTNTVVLTNIKESRSVEGKIEINSDRKGLVFTPLQPLKPEFSYSLNVSGDEKIYDVAGNYIYNDYIYFETGVVNEEDKQAPQLMQSSFPAGSDNLPVNARSITMIFNEPLDSNCINSQTVRLIRKNDSSIVVGNAVLEGDSKNVVFTASKNLDVATEYNLVLDGICDYNGNKISVINHGFAVRADATEDKSFSLATATPAAESIDVPVDSKITFSFDEQFDQSQLYGSSVSYSYIENGARYSIKLPGVWSNSEKTLTFTPSADYPFGATISAYYSLRDLAGNYIYSGTNFTTMGGLDNTPPQISKVTPMNGTMDVGPESQITLTFSEPLREGTINSDNFNLLIGGKKIGVGVTRSLDNRTVTMNMPYDVPSASLITIVATSDVTDLAGNRLLDFASTFTTAVIDKNISRPRIIRQFPVDGSSSVRQLDHITLYANKKLNAGSLFGGVYIVADGVLVKGSSALDASNQAITFTPDAPFPENALIEVYITEKVRDLSGNLLTSYSSSFRTGSALGSTSGVKPLVTAYYPINGQLDAPLNPVIEILFNEKLKLGSLSSSAIQLRKSTSTGIVQASLLSLSDDGLIVKVKPLSLLEKNTRYYVTIAANIEDNDGDKSLSSSSYYFNTGVDAIEDTQTLIMTRSSPSEGAENVPVNLAFHLAFDEPIHPLSIALQNSDQISFLVGNKEVRYIKNHVLPADTTSTELVTRITDRSGNKMLDRSITYKTGNVSDFTAANLVNSTPGSGDENVPTNTLLNVTINEPVDVLSISSSNFYLYDNVLGQNVNATFGISIDGRRLSITPSKALAVNRSYRIHLESVKDLAGNSFSSSVGFTTGPSADYESPQVSIIGITPGQLDVPRNARLRISFDEPINIQKLDGTQLLLNGLPVKVDRSLSDDGLVLTLTPSQILQSNSSYQILISDVEDLSGNKLVTSVQRTFSTTSKVDLISGSILSYNPSSYSVITDNISSNVMLQIKLSEPVDPISAQPGAFGLINSTESKSVKGNIQISVDKKTLTFVPAEPLKSGYRYSLTGVLGQQLYDLAGNLFPAFLDHDFTVNATADSEAPTVLLTSFASGSQGIPVNTQISIGFSEAMSANCVNSESFRLVRKSDSVVVASELVNYYANYGDSSTFTIMPKDNLEASTAYELVVGGVCDLSGNAISPVKFSFTTGASAAADTLAPILSSVSPVAGAANVDRNKKVVLTFNEKINAAKLNGLQVTATGYGSPLAGSWLADGNKLTFTPLVDYPPFTTIYIYCYGLKDLAGNEYNGSSTSFTTSDLGTTTTPKIQAITPANGSMDISPSQPIVINFSESLLENTIKKENFILFVDGKVVSYYNVYRSPDNRTVTLYGGIPSAKTITVVVTGDVKNIAGNALADFSSTYSTAVVNTVRPNIVRQIPLNGSSGLRNLDHITIYASKPIDATSLTDGMYVAADGVIVSGSSSIDPTNQAIKFVPNTPFPENALIEVFLNDKVRDFAGNFLYNYRSSFRTGSRSGSTLGVKPAVVAYYPTNAQVDVSLNPLMEISFNETLKASSINASTVQLRKTSSTGPIQAAILSLSEDSRIVRIKPQALLEKNTRYYISILTNIEDIDGDKSISANSYYFNTGIDAVEETQQLLVARTSPSDGADSVPINPVFHIGFDKPIHPFSFPQLGNDQISFLAGNKEVRYLKDHALPANSLVKETLSVITDRSGNKIADRDITFNTTDKVDVKGPGYPVARTPDDDLNNVPTNSLIYALMDEPINSLALSSSNFYLRESTTSLKVAANIGVSADGRRLSLTPLAPLKVSTEYMVHIDSVSDLAGNSSEYSVFSFITGTAPDNQAPQYSAIGVDDGQLDAPRNTHIHIRFNEPINSLKLDGAVLSSDGTPVKVVRTLSDDRLMLTLTPQQLLQAGAVHQLAISGIEDLSGNVLLGSENRTFTTSNKVDIKPVSIVSYIPINSSINVPLNSVIEVRFDEKIDSTSLQPRAVVLKDQTINSEVEGRFELSADKKVLRFIPLQPLKAAHTYKLNAGGDYERLYDLSGNWATAISGSFTTAN